MRWFLLLLLLILIAAPASAVENEIALGGTTAVKYSSNAQSTTNDKDDSIGFEIGPRVSYRATSDNLNLGASYLPSYSRNSARAIQTEWRHRFNMEGNYQYSPATSFTVSDTLTYGSSANKRDDDSGSPGGQDSIEYRDQDELQQTVTAAVSHAISPRISFNGQFRHNINRFEDDRLRNTDIMAAHVSGNYRWNDRLTVGTQFRVSHVDVESIIKPWFLPKPIDGSASTYYSPSGTVGYQITPKISFNMNVGPTWVVTKNDHLPNPDTQLTAFGSASLVAHWKNTESSIDFSRKEGFNADASSAQSDNTLSAQIRWNANRNWALATRFLWVRKENVDQISGNQSNQKADSDLDQFIVSGTVTRRLTREALLHFTVDYMKQKNEVNRLVSPDLDDDVDQVRAVIRLDFNMRPYKF